MCQCIFPSEANECWECYKATISIQFSWRHHSPPEQFYPSLFAQQMIREQGEQVLFQLRWWYDCIAFYAHTMALFAILLTFLKCSDHTTVSATTHILRFFSATFLQPVLHVGLGHWSTIWTIPYLRTSFPHTTQCQLLVFGKCTLSTFLHIFVTFVHFMISVNIIHQKLVLVILQDGSIK